MCLCELVLTLASENFHVRLAKTYMQGPKGSVFLVFGTHASICKAFSISHACQPSGSKRLSTITARPLKISNFYPDHAQFQLCLSWCNHSFVCMHRILLLGLVEGVVQMRRDRTQLCCDQYMYTMCIVTLHSMVLPMAELADQVMDSPFMIGL